MLKFKSLKGNFSLSNKFIKKLLSIILIIAVQAISISGLLMSGFMQIEVKAAQSTADTNANTKTKNILDNLSVLKEKSEAKVVSGQQVCDGNGMSLSDVWNPTYPVFESYDMQITDLHTTTGKWVGLQGYDMWRHDESIIDGQLVNPLTDPVQAIDSSNWRSYAKSHSDNGGLVTMFCHFRNPWGRDSLGRGKAWSDIPAGNNLGDLIDPSKPVYNTWISMMDKIASELQWFEDNDVTVLWRFLPEANGDWFWWCQGSDADFKNVWQHTFNYLTDTKGLHNLIWVYNPSENAPVPKAINRYPGSNYVDIIGIDCYRDPLWKLNLYSTFLNYGKVLALSEVGGPTNMASIISDIKTYNPNIAYYMAWAGSYSIQLNNNQSELLGDSWSVNRGDIDFSASAPTTAPTETPTATPTIAPTETPTVAPTDTVTPTPTQIPTIEPTPLAFTDLDGYEWAVQFINTLSSRGVISGNGDGTFNPGNNITRGEFAKMLTVAFGIYDPAAVSAFIDVPAGSWYNTYIASLEKEELTVGNGDGTFSPDSNMTREEMFAFNARAMAKYNSETILANDSEETGTILAGFVDGASVSDWARGYVATNVKLQIVQGSDVEDGKALNPQNPIIRAEVAIVLAKTMD